MSHTYILKAIASSDCTLFSQEFEARFEEFTDERAVMYAKNLLNDYKKQSPDCTYVAVSLTEIRDVDITRINA